MIACTSAINRNEDLSAWQTIQATGAARTVLAFSPSPTRRNPSQRLLSSVSTILVPLPRQVLHSGVPFCRSCAEHGHWTQPLLPVHMLHIGPVVLIGVMGKPVLRLFELLNGVRSKHHSGNVRSCHTLNIDRSWSSVLHDESDRRLNESPGDRLRCGNGSGSLSKRRNPAWRRRSSCACRSWCGSMISETVAPNLKLPEAATVSCCIPCKMLFLKIKKGDALLVPRSCLHVDSAACHYLFCLLISQNLRIHPEPQFTLYAF